MSRRSAPQSLRRCYTRASEYALNTGAWIRKEAIFVGWPLGTMGADTGLHTGACMPRRLDPRQELHTCVRVCADAWILNRGYPQVLEYAQAFGSHTILRTGVCIPTRDCTRVFEITIGATLSHGPLGPQPGLHTGVWIPTLQVAT